MSKVNESKRIDGGVDLRTYIAVRIMAGLVANPGGPYQANEFSGWALVNTTQADLASLVVDVADALIAKLEATP